MAHAKRGYKRSTRVAQQLHEVIAMLLLSDVDDPRVQKVQVISVEASPVLTSAKIYYVLLDQREADPRTQAGLERVEGFLKHEIGKRLDLRYMPHLSWIYDDSVERGRHMDELLSNLDIPEEDV